MSQLDGQTDNQVHSLDFLDKMDTLRLFSGLHWHVLISRAHPS